MTPEERARFDRAECPNAELHVFFDGGPICQCGLIDMRNEPPRMMCPTCGGSGRIEINHARSH